MTSEELIAEIRKIEIEQKRRKRECKIDEYNSGEKIHQKQLAFHKDNHKNRWVFGGNRSGKTECGAVETVWLARGIHPYKENKQVDVLGADYIKIIDKVNK